MVGCRNILFLVILLLFVGGMKRKADDTRNENRRLKRRAQALLKKRLIEAKIESERLENLRNKKTQSRLKKFRENIKER